MRRDFILWPQPQPQPPSCPQRGAGRFIVTLCSIYNSFLTPVQVSIWDYFMSENCEKNVEVVKVDEVKYFISGTL